MSLPQPLSHATDAVWEAFNQEEAGVFVDYGEKLAAAFEALADQVVPKTSARTEAGALKRQLRSEILAIARNLADARADSMEANR